MILAATLILFGGTAYSQESGSEHGSLAEIGQKLSNPVSDVWAMFTEFDLNFSDGDLNTGSSKVGGRMIFQPILPFPPMARGRTSGSSSPVPLYLEYLANPFLRASTTLRAWAVLETPSCPC